MSYLGKVNRDKDIISYLFVIVCMVICSGCTESGRGQAFPVLKGPYLGQEPPGMNPEIFAPGIISTGHSEQQIAFTPEGNELFLWLGESRPYCLILGMKIEGKKWSALQVAPFSGKYVDMKFSISPDGTLLLFSSNRPYRPDGKPLDNLDIWLVKRDLNHWSEPVRIDSEVNTQSHDYYPTISKKKNLYFMSDREGGMGEDDIYFACFKEGKWINVENIGSTINSKLNEGDPFIAKDERYILFCSRDRRGGFGNNDLYISYRKSDGSWSHALNMGETINTPSEEVCPIVSHDGKYLFFSSNRKKIKTSPGIPLTYKKIVRDLENPGNGSYDIYWVSARIIEDMKKKILK